MSPQTGVEAANQECFPRVSGDEPVGPGAPVDFFWFSPRERG